MADATEEPQTKNAPCVERFDAILAVINEIMEADAKGARADAQRPDGGAGADGSSALTREQIGGMFAGCSFKDLENMRRFIDELKMFASGLVVRDRGSEAEHIGFLKEYCDVLGNSAGVLQGFTTLLGYSTDPEILRVAAFRLFQVIFLRQDMPRVYFYDISLLATLLRSNFKNNAYLRCVLARLSLAFVEEICQSYVAKRRYVFSRELLFEFSRRVETLINALNGLVSELGVGQAAIPKILFVIFVFEIEKSSVFLAEFDSAELFYCAVRVFYSGMAFAKRLENMIKTKLLWSFKSDTKRYTLDLIFQSIFKAEFRRLVGSIKEAKIVSYKYSRTSVAVAACAASQPQRSPSADAQRSGAPEAPGGRPAHAFSPLSRRIAEIAGIRDDYESKRRLNFE
ncbi:hypothetical protein PAPHI01_1365 [Pancytospora philotis]|nr:hypothetical protein PAPHI01_1365 [Pancytospora philotis]